MHIYVVLSNVWFKNGHVTRFEKQVDILKPGTANIILINTAMIQYQTVLNINIP